MDSTAEKYAFEIEIFTLNRGFRAQISRSCEQKRRFQQSVRGQSGRTDFFNTIDRFLPVAIVSFGSFAVCRQWLFPANHCQKMSGKIIQCSHIHGRVLFI
jgi:hypothetical protein